jgi:Zn-dependent peptidase ImmA (M78 family)
MAKNRKFVEALERDAPDYAGVLLKVSQVLKENSVFEPPVLPKELAENYGHSVIFAEFPDHAKDVMGFLDLDTSEIFVNSADPPNRQTFTIAHELGHALMHGEALKKHPDKYTVLYRKPLASEIDPIEQEANAFAANLLVPRNMLDKYHPLATVSELARLFIVSEEVIRYRLQFEYKRFKPAAA